jgi:glycosyltransferase involved in cell wall biosynthesis
MEELAPRLVARGFDVTVYCRSHYTPRHLTEYRGVHLVVLPTLKTKHLDTPVHTFLSAIHAARQRFDAALLVNSANAIFIPLLKLGRIPTALHVDGIERQRAKWGTVGKSVYTLSERLATGLPEAVVSDAEVVRDYFNRRWNLDSWVISYGVQAQPEPPGELMAKLGLESQGYFLYVSRFEPENNPHKVAEAYRGVGGEMPLVMVGDAPYAKRFIRSFTENADRRIVFPGAIYGEGYRELLTNAYAYIHATEVGGTHPALVEAMGYGNCVVINKTPENVEAAGGTGLLFSASEPASLTHVLNRLQADPDLASEYGSKSSKHAHESYDWDVVSDRYAELLRSLASGRK